jgi:hypothetical protein
MFIQEYNTEGAPRDKEEEPHSMPQPHGTLRIGGTAGARRGHWSEKEQAKYFAFLEMFEEKFSQRDSRRECKVFKSMSQFIKTRDPNQCRSHHHKMNKNSKSIADTLHFLETKNPTLLAKSKKYLHLLTLSHPLAPTRRVPAQPIGTPSANQEETYFDGSKLNDIANLRTEACCSNSPSPQLTGFQGTGLSSGVAEFKGFPSTGLMNAFAIAPFGSGYGDEYKYEPYLFNYKNYENVIPLLSTPQAWLECYECYLK